MLSSRLLEYNRPLDFSLVPGVTGECQQSFLHYLRALKSFELWALKSKLIKSYTKDGRSLIFNFIMFGF